MSQEPSADTLAVVSRELHNLPPAEKPTVKILLYTDDPSQVVGGTGPPLGLGRMVDHLRGQAPAFANLCIKYKSRYPLGSTSAENKINVVLENEDKTGAPFDQVWFFGLHKVSKKDFTLGVGGGGPESELDEREVYALRTRMDAGLGVLMTGDHAEAPPPDALPSAPDAPCPRTFDPKTYLGLGRALGNCVPRAGLLRDWEGPPTTNPRDRNDTQVVTFGTDDNSQLSFQSDRVPQQLILRTFNERGRSVLEGRPHPLFFYRQGRAIQLYPDHQHEGSVVIPDDFPKNLWPEKGGFQPKPRVVAYGLDKRNGRRLKLVAAYDGDGAGVGRIVADSTWHHYFNVNLENFQHPGADGTATDQIGQFYRNLAFWLSPFEKRREMHDAMVLWLTRHPTVSEEVGPAPSKRLRDIMKTGRVARRLLSEVASDCEIHELLQPSLAEPYRRRYETLYLPENGFQLSTLPSKELMLGCLIHEVQEGLSKSVGLSLSEAARWKVRREAIITGCGMAFDRQARALARTAAAASQFLRAGAMKTERTEPETGLEADPNATLQSERRNAMPACMINDPRVLFMDLTLEKNPAVTERLTFLDVSITAGVITGRVFDDNDEMSALTGTCAPSIVTGEADVSLMTFVFNVKDNRGRVVGIFLTGVGFPKVADPTKLDFRGTLRAFTPTARTPQIIGGELELLAIDPGETGTGNGSQT